MNAGMLTAVPFATASILGIGIGELSDVWLSKEAVHAGSRRSAVAILLVGAACILLVGAACILLVSLLDQLWVIILLLAGVRAMGLAGSALNFALVTDLVRNRADIGKVTSITVVGGNTFGLMAPIVTGYVVGLTGSFDRAFVVAGILPLIGAVATLVMTRKAIVPERSLAVGVA